MKHLVTPTSGTTDISLPFYVSSAEQLFLVINGQLQYLNITYTMPALNLVRVTYRFRGTESVEAFTVGDPQEPTSTFIPRPAFLRLADPLPKPDGPTLI